MTARAGAPRAEPARTVDLLIAGSGAAGCAAAIRAADLGLEALVVEKARELGGVTAYSYGQVWVPGNHLGGREDGRDAALAYLEFLGGGFGDPALRRVLVDESAAVVRHLGERAGVPWRAIPGLPDYHWPDVPGAVAEGRYLEVDPVPGATLGAWAERVRSSPHAPLALTNGEMLAAGGIAASGGWDLALAAERAARGERTLGPGLASALVRAALVDRGVEAWLDARVVELVAESGAVVGAVVEREGRALRVSARRGVLLATGGYDWNPELTRSFEQLPEWHSLCPPSITGDHVALAGAVGAALAAVPPLNLSALFAIHVPGEEIEGHPRWRSAGFEAGLPHAILVNDRGERFADESFYRDLLPRARSWDGRAQRYTNLPMFLVLDAQHRARYPLAGFPAGSELPPGIAEQGDTPGALATRLGIAPDALEVTVERFNRMAREGVDRDFGRGRVPWAHAMAGDLRHRPNPNLGALEKPPFLGLRLAPVSGGINAAGLRTDRFARVVHVSGRPIPGLYAAGNAAAHLDVGAGYQSGIANLRGLVWGDVAARHAGGALHE